jgi:hypothetical protein
MCSVNGIIVSVEHSRFLTRVSKIYISRYPHTPPVKSEFRHSIILIFKCFWFFLTNKDTKNKFFLNKPNINYFSIFWVLIYKFV